jgi:hypothetical protein
LESKDPCRLRDIQFKRATWLPFAVPTPSQLPPLVPGTTQA